MKLKSLLNSILMIILFFGGVLFFTGCEKEDIPLKEYIITDLTKVSDEVKKDAIEYYGRVVSMQDFAKEKIIASSYVNELNESIRSESIGSVPENALVLLVFDSNGVLYTAKRYNSTLDKIFEIEREGGETNQITNDLIEHYYTDINTFKRVTNLSESVADYAMPLSNANGELIWFFDPYVKFFETREQQLRNANQKFESFRHQSNTETTVRSSIPSWSKLGNIIFAKWDGGGISDIFGHTGGVTLEPNGSGSNNFLLTLMMSAEASNNGKSIAGVTIGTQNGVFQRYMSTTGSNLWASSSVYQRNALWESGLTSYERESIKNYMQSQVGEPYNLASSKSNSSQWYCSKLQWKAYNVCIGVDIDSNGGSTVYPLDIVNSSVLVGMSF